MMKIKTGALMTKTEFVTIYINSPDRSGFVCWYVHPYAKRIKVNGKTVTVTAKKCDAQRWLRKEAEAFITEALGIRLAEDGEPQPGETVAVIAAD